MKETERQVKFQETSEQCLLFSAAKKGNLTWRYLPEPFLSPVPIKTSANAETRGSACSGGLIQLSDM